MKKFFFILSSFFLLVGPIQFLNASEEIGWDAYADQQIESCFHSPTFQNISILYSYEHQNWELRIVYNPERKKIQVGSGKESMFQFTYGVFSRDSIPPKLKLHLENLIKNQLGNSNGGYWGIASYFNGSLVIDYYKDAVPAPTQPQVEKETPQKENKTDKVKSLSDQVISQFFEGEEFKKLSLDFSWEGSSYPVHFVYNPSREALISGGLSQPVYWPLAFTIASSSYPLKLAQHIKSLIPNELLNDPESMIDVATWISYYRKNPISIYTGLSPALFLKQIENPEVDAEIVKLFTSEIYEKKSLWYELDGNYYGVLLIHNPEKLNLQSKIEFEMDIGGKLQRTIIWSSKVGIFTNQKAPQELIDHISQLANLSWWDGYWNLSLHNGDKVSVTYVKGNWEYTYTPETWYTVMENAKP